MSILITCGSGFIGKNRLQEGGEPRESVRVMNRTFWIGVYPGLMKEMLDHVRIKGTHTLIGGVLARRVNET